MEKNISKNEINAERGNNNSLSQREHRGEKNENKNNNVDKSVHRANCAVKK